VLVGALLGTAAIAGVVKLASAMQRSVRRVNKSRSY